MENKIYKKFIQEVSKIKMTRTEKDRVLMAILESQPASHIAPVKNTQNNTHKNLPIKSPWNIYTVRSWIHLHRAVTVSIAIVIIISLGGGGVVSASGGSLPGDTLYPLKVNVVEPVKVALRNSPETKAVAQTELVNLRLEEAEILAVNDILDDEKVATLEALIDEHSDAFAIQIERVREGGDDDTADDISISLQAQMNAHSVLLAKIEDSKISSSDIAMNTFAVRSMKTAPVSSEAPIDVAIGAPEVATLSMSAPEKRDIRNKIAEKISNIRIKSEESEDKPKFDEKKYEEKKIYIKKYIENTKSELSKQKATSTEEVGAEENSWKNEIIIDSDESLNEAMESLKSAEEHEKKGDKESAYSDLRKSERATGKADTIIRSGLKIDKEKREKQGRDRHESKKYEYESGEDRDD